MKNKKLEIIEKTENMIIFTCDNIIVSVPIFSGQAYYCIINAVQYNFSCGIKKLNTIESKIKHLLITNY